MIRSTPGDEEWTIANNMLNQGSISRDEQGSSAKGNPKTDRQLIQRVAQGDHSAFSELYDAFNISLFNYLLRLVNNQHIAEELLQETFIAVWNGAGRFRGKATVKTWIFRIGHNQAVSWLRKESGKELVDEMEIPGAEHQTEEKLMLEWQTEQLVEALTDLSANHRAVIELVFEHELTYAEVALVMDCPVGTVKSRMSYALKRLNRLLNSQI